MCSTQTLCARCTHKHTHTKYTAHTLCVLGASRYSRTILMQSICTRYTNTYTDVSARSLLLHTHIHTYTHIRTPTHIRTHTHTHSHTCNYTHAYAGECVLHHCSLFLHRHTDTHTCNYSHAYAGVCVLHHCSLRGLAGHQHHRCFPSGSFGTRVRCRSSSGYCLCCPAASAHAACSDGLIRARGVRRGMYV